MALASNALTTLDAVKGELSIEPSDSSDDVLLERYINVASNAAEEHCGRRFVFTVVVAENVRGFGTQRINILRAPIVSVSEIRWTFPGLDPTLVDPNDFEIDGDGEAGLIYRAGGWPWAVSGIGAITNQPLPGTERYNIEVDYSGGFVTPQQEIDTAGGPSPLTRNLPFDLEDAIIQMVTNPRTFSR